jgi:hypothetical protein
MERPSPVPSPGGHSQGDQVQVLIDESAEGIRVRDIARARGWRSVLLTPPSSDKGIARPAHGWYRSRDQEPAQLRQQFLGSLGRLKTRFVAGRRAVDPRGPC